MTEKKYPDFLKHFLHSDFLEDVIAWKMKEICERHTDEYKRLHSKHGTYGLKPHEQEDKEDHRQHAIAFKHVYIYFSGDYNYKIGIDDE